MRVSIGVSRGALSGPLLLPWGYSEVDWTSIRKPPDFAKGHFMGTDQNGRDMLARTMQGTQMSLIVAGVATLVSVVIGIIYGAVAGYFGGRIDAVMMRFVDIMYALPYILFVIILVVIFGRNRRCCSSWASAVSNGSPWRASCAGRRSVAQADASSSRRHKAGGARALRLSSSRHIVPNLTGPVVIYATLTIPGDHHH